MREQYVLGVDFGTESARALLVATPSGDEVGHAELRYAHGVVDTHLPSTGAALPPHWALQDPDDYTAALRHVVREVLADADVDPDQVVGLGIDTTACTVVPTTADGTPLSRLPEHRSDPHAWAKLWKHHGAQPQADRVNAAAEAAGGLFLPRYGGKISSEWLLPKALQILEESPAAYHAADRLIEAHDWLVWQLTGVEARSAQAAGFKGTFRSEGDGYPSRDFLASLDPAFADLADKLSTDVHAPGTRAGGLTDAWAHDLGLLPGTAVAVGNMDAQVALAPCGATTPGRMVLVMGTSVCNLLLAPELQDVEGMAGVVRDAIVPGLWAYEAGQAAVGDMFGWFVKNQVPAAYTEEAERRGVSIFTYLEEKAAALRPGQSGVVALDWFNGNRSVLVDAHLSGVVLGLTLGTRPEDVYRALLESAAFGQRTIIEAFEGAGVTVDDIVACGGLPGRSPLLMQLLADVTRREIRVSASTQAAALGAALHAAVAAGAQAGGFDSLQDASAAFTRLHERTYRPDAERAAAYDTLFADYTAIHDFFGRDNPELMHRLARGRADAYLDDQARHNDVRTFS